MKCESCNKTITDDYDPSADGVTLCTQCHDELRMAENEIGHCEVCSKPIYENDEFFTEDDYPMSLWHVDCPKGE